MKAREKSRAFAVYVHETFTKKQNLSSVLKTYQQDSGYILGYFLISLLKTLSHLLSYKSKGIKTYTCIL